MSAPLDLRHLPPPEPMQCVLDALDALAPGMRLVALTPHRPGPLLPMLEQQGYAWRIEDLDDGAARIAIWRTGEVAVLPAASLHGPQNMPLSG